MTDAAKNFNEYLLPENILCGMHGVSGKDVVKQLIDLLKKADPELDGSAFDEVMKRESLFSTMIAPGLAVPHARLATLKKPLVAMACSSEGFEFTEAGKPVHVMVLMLSPMDEPNLHMQIMAALAMDFRESSTIQKVGAMKTAAEVIQFFGGKTCSIPEYLTAADVMETDFTVLKETDTLQKAIDIFATTRLEEMPVVDSTGDLRGVLSLHDLMRFCLPEHLLWMENLSPIYRFQPFADMLKTSGDTRVADVMRDQFVSVHETVPAVQLAKLFLVNSISCLIILDKSGKLAGVVHVRDFCAKFFWQ